MTESTSQATSERAERQPRVAPSVAIGILPYVGYLAIFFATWAINDVDYETIGDTAESAKLHYAFPTLFASAFLVVAVTALGWWRITLFDKERSGPAWAWFGPIAMVLLAAGSYATINTGNIEEGLVLWSVLGAIGVGFGEEMVTRGTLLVGLRSRFPEGKVWLYSTLLFSALHIPNVIFGLRPSGLAFQLLNTFIFGSFLYAMRRLSGTLLLPMFLHGLWDSSVFLPDATGADLFPSVFILLPIAIVCAWVVIRRNRNLRLA